MNDEKIKSKDKDLILNDKLNKDLNISKALLFLMNKDIKDKSLEEKREYLKSKIPADLIDEAVKLLPTVEEIVQQHEKEYISKNNNNQNTILDYLKGFSIYSSLIFVSLGVNYLLDLTRNKKNDVFFKNLENKINSEINNMSSSINKNVYETMSNYVKKDDFSILFDTNQREHSSKKGLNLNVIPQNVKVQVKKLEQDVDEMKISITNMSNNNENNKILIKQEILKECSSIIESNNNKISNKINEDQKNFLIEMNKMMSDNIERNMEKMYNMLMNVNSLQNRPNNLINLKDNNNQIENYSLKTPNSNIIQSDENEVLNSSVKNESFKGLNTIGILNNKIDNNNSNIASSNNNNTNNDNNQDDNNVNKSDKIKDFETIFQEILTNISDYNIKLTFFNGIKNQFQTYSKIEENTSKEDLSKYFINITNTIYKNTGQKEKIIELLKISGFEKVNELRYNVSDPAKVKHSFDLINNVNIEDYKI